MLYPPIFYLSNPSKTRNNTKNNFKIPNKLQIIRKHSKRPKPTQLTHALNERYNTPIKPSWLLFCSHLPADFARSFFQSIHSTFSILHETFKFVVDIDFDPLMCHYAYYQLKYISSIKPSIYHILFNLLSPIPV